MRNIINFISAFMLMLSATQMGQAQEVSQKITLPKSMHGTWIVKGFEPDFIQFQHRKDYQKRLEDAQIEQDLLSTNPPADMTKFEWDEKMHNLRYNIRDARETLEGFKRLDKISSYYLDKIITINADHSIDYFGTKCTPKKIRHHDDHSITFSTNNQKAFHLNPSYYPFWNYGIDCDYVSGDKVSPDTLKATGDEIYYDRDNPKGLFSFDISITFLGDEVHTLVLLAADAHHLLLQRVPLSEKD